MRGASITSRLLQSLLGACETGSFALTLATNARKMSVRRTRTMSCIHNRTPSLSSLTVLANLQSSLLALYMTINTLNSRRVGWQYVCGRRTSNQQHVYGRLPRLEDKILGCGRRLGVKDWYGGTYHVYGHSRRGREQQQGSCARHESARRCRPHSTGSPPPCQWRSTWCRLGR